MFFQLGVIKKLGTFLDISIYILGIVKLEDFEDNKRRQYFRINFRSFFKFRISLSKQLIIFEVSYE